ncbi:hypothetical protein GINT2_000085 [Glugoides intestinalis]
MASGDKKTLTKKIVDVISTKKNYEDPKVTSEGYGSLIDLKEASDMAERAAALKEQAELLGTAEAIPLYFDSLYCYFRILAKESKCKNIREQCLDTMKHLVKFINKVIYLAKNFKCEKEVKALEWALFNLKIIKMFKEWNLLPRNAENNAYLYILDTLRTLEGYYDLNSSEQIVIVEFDRIEDEIKRRL